MPRPVDANTVLRQFDLLMREVEGGRRVIVEDAGTPRMALVPIADLENLAASDEGDWWEHIQQFRAEMVRKFGPAPLTPTAEQVIRDIRDNE